MESTAKEASLIVCHHTNNRRILVEMREGSRYLNSGNETKSRVKVILASEEVLRKELAKISIKIDDLPSVKIIAQKFWKELVDVKGGTLAWHEGGENRLYEILETVSED